MLLRFLLFAALLAGLAGCDAMTPAPTEDVPVKVGMVALDESNAPVVVLEEQDGHRWLPIWIGSAEATSIAAEMDDEPLPRPNTHDLANQVILGLRGEVERVVVTELRGNTYYAILTLRSHGKRVDLDSRPSDAIAIALRAGAPIFVRASVFSDAAGPSELRNPDGQRIRWHDRPTGSSEATLARTL
jgi:hypothetical protein